VALRVGAGSNLSLAAGVTARRTANARVREEESVPAQPRDVEATRRDSAEATRARLPVRVNSPREATDARLERIRLPDEPGTATARRGASAYLAVERSRIAESAGGELVGVDLYV